MSKAGRTHPIERASNQSSWAGLRPLTAGSLTSKRIFARERSTCQRRDRFARRASPVRDTAFFVARVKRHRATRAVVFRRSDRIELSLLGVLLLTWAFVVAPLMHQLQHQHAHSHQQHQGAGTLEHYQVALSSAPAVPGVKLVLIALAAREPMPPRRAELVSRRASASPQGP